jgi:valyl-tRNA synthetase
VQPDVNRISAAWFDSVFNNTLKNIFSLYENYRLSEALMAVYKLIWDDFCSWYLEMIKPAYQQPVDPITLDTAIGFFEKLLKVLHPFMPFISEEIWQNLRSRHIGESVMISGEPVPGDYNQELIRSFTFAEEVIMAVRNIRKERNLAQKDPISLYIRKNNSEEPDTTFDDVAKKLCNLHEIQYTDDKVANAIAFIVGSTEFYIPLSSRVDVTEELQKLEEELAYTRGFLEKVMLKLGNVGFVNNAPEKVVESERKKQSDAESRIRVLEGQIASLRGL